MREGEKKMLQWGCVSREATEMKGVWAKTWFLFGNEKENRQNSSVGIFPQLISGKKEKKGE